MEIRFTLTLDDYREANRLFLLSSTFRRKLNFYLFVRFGVPTGVILLLPLMAEWVLNLRGPISESGELVAVLSAGLAGVGVICLASPFSYRRKTARYFKEMNLPMERVATITDSGILVAHGDGAAEGRFTWPVFEKSAESDGMFVLFPNKRQFVTLPKRAMTAEQQREFRALLAAHGLGSDSRRETAAAVS